MPDLPQHIALPRLGAQALEEVERWGNSLIQQWIRVWSLAIQTVNALSRVDTLANRPTTPALDHVFFTTSDSKQTFVGVSGAWENVGPRRGSATITNPATTAAVTLTPNEANANYRLAFLPDYNAGAVWHTAKASTGFTVNVVTTPGVSGVVDWQLTRD